ncbi:MAG: FecR family protein [Desulfocapsaceae bacterium]|nr:FecR family protein [Desulfocapsaceae bacterium]
MMKFFSVLSLIFFMFIAANPCLAKIESIGFIDNVQGEVLIISGETSVQGVPNMKILPGDLIRTGSNSSVGLIMEDDTVLSLGPKSEIEIQEFLFDPAERNLSFVAKMIRGTFSFITGQIAKLAPRKVKLETPDATLAVRGTKFVVEID